MHIILAILLAAGSIMISACGQKKQMCLLIKQYLHRPKAKLRLLPKELPARKNLHLKRRLPEDTESSKFYMLQGTITKTEKKRLCIYLTG